MRTIIHRVTLCFALFGVAVACAQGWGMTASTLQPILTAVQPKPSLGPKELAVTVNDTGRPLVRAGLGQKQNELPKTSYRHLRFAPGALRAQG